MATEEPHDLRLHTAVKQKKPHVIIDLLSAKMNVDTRNELGLTPLHCAAYLNAGKTIMGLLLDGKADLHTKTTGRGLTVLHCLADAPAQISEDELVVSAEYAMERGAKSDVDSKDKLGLTPFALAMKRARFSLASLYQKHEKLSVSVEQKDDDEQEEGAKPPGTPTHHRIPQNGTPRSRSPGKTAFALMDELQKLKAFYEPQLKALQQENAVLKQTLKRRTDELHDLRQKFNVPAPPSTPVAKSAGAFMFNVPVLNLGEAGDGLGGLGPSVPVTPSHLRLHEGEAPVAPADSVVFRVKGEDNDEGDTQSGGQ